MNSETKTCQNCRTQFTIEPDDFAFYEKIGVPAPTWCPECRMLRLMMWRNERNLYRRKDGHSGKEIISIFSPDKPLIVYDRAAWWGNSWDSLQYGREYDFSKPFFRQFSELMERVPLVALFNNNAVNSDYCNHTEDSKNCYLIFASIWNENVSYSNIVSHCKDAMDLCFGNRCELAYENVNCNDCYDVSFSKNSTGCNNSRFLMNCRGCSNCFGCVNLRNKSYYFFNQPHTKEEYEKKIAEIDMGSFRALEEMRSKFLVFGRNFPRRFAQLINSPGSTGEMLIDCKNCRSCFDLMENVENCRYMKNGGYGMKDSELGYGVGIGELMDEVIDTGIGTSHVFAAVVSRNSNNAYYIFDCHGVSNVFGCVGVRNKQCCILNKQYSREEYEALLPKIIQHMNDMPYTDAKGRIYRYGEFFPPELSPFAYNETIAQEYFPLTAEEAEKRGYRWKQPEEKAYAITKQPDDLSDHIRDIQDSIIKETIACLHQGACNEQCTTAFRMIPQELAFYRRMNLPIPRLCPNCRHHQRLKQRNPMKLWHRVCTCGGAESGNAAYKNQAQHFHGSAHCPNEFETSYAPDRSEIVYCEQCYQAEIL